jgi:hypothetical protein
LSISPLIYAPVHTPDFGAILRPTKTRWMSFSYALGEISNASTILVNGIPTLLFQFARARKI